MRLQGSFLVFWLTYLATLCVGIALAYTIAALSPTMDVANAALPTYVGSLAFVSGFLIRFDDMPAAWRVSVTCCVASRRVHAVLFVAPQTVVSGQSKSNPHANTR